MFKFFILVSFIFNLSLLAQVKKQSIHALHIPSVVLCHHLKENNTKTKFYKDIDTEFLAISIAPLKVPAFLKINNASVTLAALEQSLPLADIENAREDGGKTLKNEEN